jgi:hypothetical protein
MKTTLRDKLLLEIGRIDNRIKQLIEYVASYKESDDYESAMKCDIKRRQLELVSENLKDIL